MQPIKLIFALLVPAVLTACGGGQGNPADKYQASSTDNPVVNPIEADPMQNKGIGPVKELVLDPVDPALALEGQKVYEEKCSACHKPDKQYIGPAPKGIMDRRSPEWIMNMILNPEEMLREDPIAKQLLAEANGAIMANQGLTEDEARKILEYFRTLE